MRAGLLALLLCGPVLADAIDYSALWRELQQKKGDTELMAYIAKDLRLARQLDEMDGATQSCGAKIQLLKEEFQLARQRIADAQSQRAMALLMAIGSNGATAMGRQALQAQYQGPDPYQLEMQLLEVREQCRSMFVDLLLAYREAEASMLTERALAAKKKRHTRPQASAQQK